MTSSVAESTASLAITSTLSPALSWTAVLAREHVRHTCRMYFVLGIAGVCVSPIVYAVAYAGCRQNRAVVIDTAARFEQRAGSCHGGRTATSLRGHQVVGAGAQRQTDGRGVYGDDRHRDDDEEDGDGVPLSGDDGDILVSAADGAIVAGPSNVQQRTESDAPFRAAPVGKRDADGTASPSSTTESKTESKMIRLLAPFFKAVLRAKHASNHDFGLTCAGAVLPPYYRSLVRHVLRGLAVNLTVHALLFSVCAALDAVVPLSAAPSASLTDTSPAARAVGGDGDGGLARSASVYEDLWHGMNRRLGEMWTGLCRGPSLFSSELAATAAPTDHAALPLQAMVSWATLYDFILTTRFAPLGYYSTPVMHVCTLWWCLCGQCGVPWQRTSSASVAASVTVWRSLSASGLFLVGALNAVHGVTRHALLARWSGHACESTRCAEKQQGSAAADSTATPHKASRTGVCRRCSAAAAGLSRGVVVALAHGVGAVVVEYVTVFVQGGGSGRRVSASSSPPLFAVLFSLLSLQ